MSVSYELFTKTPGLNHTSENQSCISIRKLGMSYHGKEVLNNINLDLASNAVNALIGPSGCGKSSLLHCINRMTDHIPGCTVNGDIYINEQNILDRNTDLQALRRKTGIVFQSPSPFPFSIEKNFFIPFKSLGLRSKTEMQDRMEYCLKQVGLWNEINAQLKKPATQLSGGQQQRLMIARTLSLQPEIILFDEPCSALDPISTKRIEDCIMELKAHLTIVIVTHNIAQARRISDYTTLFWQKENKGFILERGASKDFFQSPQHPLTKAYIQGDSA